MSEFEQELPKTAPGVVFSRVDEGGVLLSTDDEVYYGLNDVGAEIWEGLDHEETLDGLCARLEDRYPEVEPGTLRADVVELLGDLSELGLLSRAGTGKSRDEPA